MSEVKNERAIAITRIFDAPRSRVFAAWTDAEHLAHWFGPKSFTVPSCETDPRPGGAFRVCMRSPQGDDYWVRGVFREFVAPERLVIACIAEGEGGFARLEEVIEVTLAEHDGKTRVTLNVTASGATDEAAAILEGMPKTWAKTVDRLDRHLVPKS
jgi:uncharacterized protein YndB with AHSA1/START domain